jgi:hypothetical protein
MKTMPINFTSFNNTGKEYSNKGTGKISIMPKQTQLHFKGGAAVGEKKGFLNFLKETFNVLMGDPVFALRAKLEGFVKSGESAYLKQAKKIIEKGLPVDDMRRIILHSLKNAPKERAHQLVEIAPVNLIA